MVTSRRNTAVGGTVVDGSPSTRPSTAPARIDVAVVALAVAASTVLRFVTTSPLWLDEALSVNIAALPLSDIPAALRQDGHPPAYYLLLHVWMEAFGRGDVAVRALSGLFSVAALPLAWTAGRRRAGPAGGLAVLVITAVAPYSLRYATETRMYALVWFLTLAGWLLADDLRRRGSRPRWVGLAAVTGLALLTHYWVLYLVAAAVGALVYSAWWARAGWVDRAGAVRVGSAMAAGGLLFLPWLPSFVFQAANTGTPWGTATRPTRAVTELVGGLGGGDRHAEGPLFGWTVLVLALVGLLAVAGRGRRIELDVRSVPTVRAEVVVAGLTLTIGLAAGAVSSSTFVARYGAVFLPLVFVAAGVGLVRIPEGAPRRLVAVALLVFAAVGAAFNVTDDRTQGAEFASAIAERGSAGDVVAFCPDQLGPSTLRELPESFDAAGLPALDRPDRIDWVDYADRNRAADPAAVADSLARRAGDGAIWLVYNGTYRTYEGFCEQVVQRLAGSRSSELVVASRERVFENASLYRFTPS